MFKDPSEWLLKMDYENDFTTRILELSQAGFENL